MMGEIEDRDTAVEIAEEYAEAECVGQLGEIIETERDDGTWIVEFRTHTFSDAYEHEVRISRAGNVFKHDRTTRFE